MIHLSKQTAIAAWLKQCPELNSLWNISAYEQDGANVIIPAGTSYRRKLNERLNAVGGYEADIIPLPSVYEEYQINCYRTIVDNDNDFNTLNFEDVEKVIEWITEQDESGNFPQIDNKKIIAVECFPFIPQIQGVDPDTGLICYYITLRITYLNDARGRSFEWPM